MEILKRLFGGGAGSSSGAGGARPGDPNGIYYYVRPSGCDEVVRVRIDRNNDLSLEDDNKSYRVHKSVRGVKCFQTVDLYLYFDSNRRFTTSEIEHGALVTQADYESWQEQSQ